MTDAALPAAQADPVLESATHESAAHESAATDEAAPEALLAAAAEPLPTALAPVLAPPVLNPDYGDATGMIAAIDRLEAVLEHETAAIGRLSTGEMKDLNRRKSLCLLEFTRAARPLAEQTVSEVLRDRLGRLRDAIARNQAVLTTHLDAVREIAATIAGAMEARDSDGTYAERPVPVRVGAPAAGGSARR
ncbi:hypothetical protein [Salinarimonas ramus]|uniref:FlgN protein n=1 Tax=Salinarimonas ramus TaxID=690164 RepID=A0A917Q7S7_9HYPH|nr:hypothetical protein [Salinarimonas ramus]GGK33756.1 hypothetical protein GCM10011322_20530 [Salinarimonas ramus]